MKRIWSFFASVKLTVSLAAIICIVAAYGSIIAVRHPEFYRALDQIILLPWLFKKGFTYLKFTFWIYALIFLTALFALNTAVCTADRLYGIVKTRLPIQSFYPQIVHIGFLVALLGHLAGGAWGFRTYGNVLVKGAVVPVPRMEGLSMRLDGFEATETPEGEMTSLKTRITLLEGSKEGITPFEVLTDEIGINDPLLYRGVAFYHVDQGKTPTGVILEAGGARFEAGFYTRFKTRSGAGFSLGEIFPDFRLDEKGNPYSASKEFANPHVEIISAKGNKGYLDISRPGNSVTIDSETIRLAGYVQSDYVALNISKDPGIWLIITGSVMLVTGMLLLLFLRGDRAELMPQKKSPVMEEA